MYLKYLVLIVLGISSVNGYSACNVDLPNNNNRIDTAESAIYQYYVENSDNNNVRAAFANNNCTIKKGFHLEGQPCPGTQVKNHITVQVGNTHPYYHIFPHYRVAGNYLFCTTPPFN